MENATKALLIAAAVLIAIILIAFGMKIFNSSSETTKVATSTGETITSQTGIATSTAVDSMQGATSYLGGETIKNAQEFNSKVYKSIESIQDNNGLIETNKVKEIIKCLEQLKTYSKQANRNITIRTKSKNNITIDDMISSLEKGEYKNYKWFDIKILVADVDQETGYYKQVTFEETNIYSYSVDIDDIW